MFRTIINFIKESQERKVQNLPLMRLVIILSLVCVNALCLPLRLEAREENPVSGQLGKHRWSLNNTKLKVEDTRNEKLY